jgi:hypothetical protein
VLYDLLMGNLFFRPLPVTMTALSEAIGSVLENIVASGSVGTDVSALPEDEVARFVCLSSHSSWSETVSAHSKNSILVASLDCLSIESGIMPNILIIFCIRSIWVDGTRRNRHI